MTNRAFSIPRVSRLGRRQLLAGLGAGAALAPFVPLLEARGDATAPPKRLLLLYSSNGTIYDRWKPSQGPGGLVLSEVLAPLEPYKDRLLVVGGLAYKAEIEKGAAGGGHEGGMPTALTGSPSRRVDANVAGGNVLATGPSVDQYLAKKLGYRTALCGVQVDSFANTLGCTSYAGDFQPLRPENDPRKVFASLFGDFHVPGQTVDPEKQRRREDRRLVVDFLGDDFKALKAKLGREEQRKLEAHTEGLLAIKAALDKGASASSLDSCAVPELAFPDDVYRNDDIPALSTTIADMLVMAMACDVIRGGTIQFGRAGANHRLTWLGEQFAQNPNYQAGVDETEGIHSFAHDSGNSASRDGMVIMNQWYARQVKYLLDKLSAVDEAGGKMIDNTLVVWFNELGDGGTHSITDTPWVVAGNAGGYFKTGQFVDFPNEPHNRLLLTLCHAMGLTDTASFGDANYCAKGPLSGVTG